MQIRSSRKSYFWYPPFLDSAYPNWLKKSKIPLFPHICTSDVYISEMNLVYFGKNGFCVTNISVRWKKKVLFSLYITFQFIWKETVFQFIWKENTSAHLERKYISFHLERKYFSSYEKEKTTVCFGKKSFLTNVMFKLNLVNAKEIANSKT